MQNEERTYLNENRYQNNKRKLTRIAVIIMVIGVVAGLSLLLTGIIKANASEKALAQELEIRKPQLESEIEILEKQYDEVGRQKQEEFLQSGFSDRYYELDAQQDKVYETLTDLESELWDIEHGHPSFGSMEKSKYTGISVMIIVISLAIGGQFLFMANGRGMMAFQTQAMMPVAKEGIQEMAPVMGEMMGTMAKEVKKSLDENENLYRDLANKQADINSGAVRTTARTVQEGFSSASSQSQGKKTCRYCGVKIDSDSVFCESCGRQL